MPGSPVNLSVNANRYQSNAGLPIQAVATPSHTLSSSDEDNFSVAGQSSTRGAALRQGIRQMFSCITACVSANPASVDRHAVSLGAVNGRPAAQRANATPPPQEALETKQRAMLTYAARGDLINLIISAELYPGQFTNLRDSHGNTLLHLAVTSGNVNAAVFCLNSLNGDLESRNHDGRTPLLVAAAHGRSDTIEMLLDWGADILAHDNQRQSVFTLAIVHCKPETYRLLERKLGEMLRFGQ